MFITPEMAKANVECITDINQIMKALQWAAREPHVGWDWETNRLRPYEEGAKDYVGGGGYARQVLRLSIEHPGAGYSKKQVAEVKELVRRFLTSASCVKYVHNLAFETRMVGDTSSVSRRSGSSPGSIPPTWQRFSMSAPVAR